MSDQDGLVFAFALDGRGGGRDLGWQEIRNRRTEEGVLWVHLDYAGSETRRWIEEESGIEPVVREALLAREPRPRSFAFRDGLLVILRGVNLNPGADPEDMVSIRLWIEGGRVVSLRHRRVMAVQDLRTAILSGDGPVDAGEFLVDLTDRLTNRMGSVLAETDDEVDALEDEVLEGQSYELRAQIGEIRRKIISLRRYLAPQRDVMSRLQGERVSWLDEMDRAHLRESGDRTTRYVEDLDSARDRAAVAQDELNSRLSEQMNKTMYVLSIVAGIFLPLGLLTGLLGINVGGIPGTENRWAFAVVCALLVGIAVLQAWFFRKMRWI